MGTGHAVRYSEPRGLLEAMRASPYFLGLRLCLGKKSVSEGVKLSNSEPPQTEQLPDDLMLTRAT